MTAGRRCRIDYVGGGRLEVERMRASLRGGPFSLIATNEPVAPEDVDLYVVPVDEAAAAVTSARGVPVIARGPGSLLRAAFLAGCVDYLREPWETTELTVRASAALERVAARQRFPWGELNLEELPSLAPAEARMLRLLLAHRGEVVTREALACAASGRPPRAGSRTVDVQIASLRRKLAAAVPRAGGGLIKAARGRGYLIV